MWHVPSLGDRNRLHPRPLRLTFQQRISRLLIREIYHRCCGTHVVESASSEAGLALGKNFHHSPPFYLPPMSMLRNIMLTNAPSLWKRMAYQAVSALGITCAVLVPAHMLLYFFGRKVRAWSKFALHDTYSADADEPRL